jgi:PAS domain S-box-containing protein
MSQLSLETSADGIVIIEADGTIAMVNRELEHQFGYVRDELVGQPGELLVPDASRLVHSDLRDRYVRDPEARSMGLVRHVNGRRNNGSECAVPIELSPLTSYSGVFLLATVVDMTDRNRV